MIENPAMFFADFGRLAMHGEATARVLWDEPTVSGFEGLLAVAQLSVTLPRAQLPDAVSGQVLTIEGADYAVREVNVLGDGALKRLILKRSP